MSKDKRVYEDDDGRTIASMEGLEDHGRQKAESRNQKVKNAFKEIGFTKKETRAMIKGAYLAYLPMFLIFIGCMALVYWLFYFLW